MSEQLKPCPFCGGDALINCADFDEWDDYETWVECLKCGSQAPDSERWNARTTTDAGERADADELKRLKLFRTMMESAATNVTTPMFVKAVVDSADEAIELLMSRDAERSSGGAGE